MSFKNIKFGMAAAEKERSNNPRLLIDGYLDAYGYIDEIRYGSKFLILGPKGSGKSAIASKLDLLSKNRSNQLFTLIDDLESFSFGAFSGIFTGTESPETRYPNHWEFILLIALMNSIAKDKQSLLENSGALETMIKALRELGMLPSKTLTDIVKCTTKKEFKLGLAQILEASYAKEVESGKRDIDYLWSNLKEICYYLKLENMHIVIIDGLDDVLTKSVKQYSALSALILAADRMNKKLASNNVNAKIVVLCRTDLFDRLKGPNNNKIKHDSGIILDWYQDTQNLSSTNLYKLVNLRAKISLNSDIDVFKKYLPPAINGQDSTVKLLFDHTRHTPRDMVCLLGYIQQHTTGENPTHENITSALRSYSLDYFIPEIKDELVGYIDRDDEENIIKLLINLNKHKFKMSELEALIVKDKDEKIKAINLYSILEALFNCSAIGNVTQAGAPRYTMKYRNRYAKFNPNEVIVIHRGLQKGLNITG